MNWGMPDRGDWVRTTKLIPLTLTDAALGTGLRRGTRGVVNERVGSRVTADFDTGYGIVTATIDASACHVERRGGGHGTFRRAVGTMTIVRGALAAFLLWPVLHFVGAYLWSRHSPDGMAEAFVLGALDGFGDWLLSLVQHPIQTLLYAAFLTVLSKIAFRR